MGSTAKILDYSSAQLIPIFRGNAAIYDDYIYLIHTTNISDFKAILQQSEDFIPKFKDLPMYNDILHQQHDEISHILRTLEIPKRHTRAINFLGSALKFVAGTPDNDDYNLLLTKQNYLIENNNKQSKINSILQNKINEITDQINVFKLNYHKNTIVKEEKTPIFEFLANRNNLVINYLNNVVLSIVLAKNNMINPLILDETDINSLIEYENLPISISNLLLVTKVKVLQNNFMIHYILKIPKISDYCNYLKIFPVSHNNTIVQLDSNEAAKCNDVTHPLSECVETTSEHICKPTKSPCLSALLNNNSASCPSQSSYHLPPVDEIEDGIIILNDVSPTWVTDTEKILVKGTFLIMFKTTIKLNDTFYKIKKNATVLEAHPPKTVFVNFTDYEHKISLPYLHRINIENTNQIETLSDDLKNHQTWWWSTTGVLSFLIFTIAIVLCFIKFFCKRANQQSAEITTQQLQIIIDQLRHRSEDESNLRGGEVMV